MTSAPIAGASVASAPAARNGRRRSPLPDWVPDLPSAPGVYQFEAECGTVLYVGKSVNLKRRVRGYFYGGGPKSERLAEMIALARSVRTVPTGSDLEARLEEAERIVAGRPRYNRALKNRARGWYVEINWRDPFPRLRVVRVARRPNAQYFGPYRGRALPEQIVRLTDRLFSLRSCPGRIVPDPAASPCLSYGLDLCTGPCVGDSGLSEYRAQVERAARLLTDSAYGLALSAEWTRERDRLSAEWAFEKAARWQRRLDWLAELEDLRAALEKPWLDGSWVVVLPHVRPGRAILMGFVGGRVLPRRTICWDDPDWCETVIDTCYATRVAGLRMEPVLDPADLVPGLIVTNWLFDGAPEGLPIALDDLNDDEVVERLHDRWIVRPGLDGAAGPPVGD